MEKIIGAIASALNLDATELAAELKDGENWLEEGKIAEALLPKMSAQVKAAKEAQYKRGVREKGVAVGKFLSKSGFSNADNLEGDALLEAYTEHIRASAEVPTGGDPKAMPKEELAKLPFVKELVNEGKQSAGAKLAEMQAAHDAERRKWEGDRVKDLAAARIPEFLDGAKVILDVHGVDGSRAARIRAISSQIDWSSVRVGQDGGLVFVDADGNPKTDDFGKPMDFKKHVVEIGSATFGTHAATPGKGGAGPTGTPSGGQSGGKVYSFASTEDFNAQYMREADAAKRSQMLKDFKQQQSEAGT